MNTKINLSGLELDNPIIPAAGTFGYGEDFKDFYDLNILGSFVMKGTTKYPRFGSETYKIAETYMGMINSMGLQNPGIDALISEELPNIKKFFRKKVIANISGFYVGDFVYCAKVLDREEQVGIIEINVSCPNMDKGNKQFGASADDVSYLTRAIKEVTTKPVYIKLTPNVTDIVEIAKSAEEAGADGISLIHSIIGMRIDISTGKPMLPGVIGGVSGPAIFPIALRMVYQVSNAVNIPVIGIGGISRVEDVIEMMYAGASAVQIGSGNFKNPCICKEIIDDLPKVMSKYGIDDLNDIINNRR